MHEFLPFENSERILPVSKGKSIHFMVFETQLKLKLRFISFPIYNPVEVIFVEYGLFRHRHSHD